MFIFTLKKKVFLSSSAVEQTAVNRPVGGSNPSWGARLSSEYKHGQASNDDKPRRSQEKAEPPSQEWVR